MPGYKKFFLLLVVGTVVGSGMVMTQRLLARDRTTQAILQEAEAFKPEGKCSQGVTPARHLKSGASYDFPSNCIPDGWVRTR